MTSHIIHKTLSNGMEVYLHPTDAAPVVSLQILVKVGSIDEEDVEGGMAHVLEHMLFKGTKKFSQIGQIASMVEAAGGDINAYTTFDHTNYYLTAPSDFTFQGTEMLLDVVSNSLLDSAELTKELEVVLEEIKRGEDSPNAVISHSLFAQTYQGNRLERPVIGYRKVVEKFERDSLMRFYKKWYAPNNMILIAAGDFQAEKLYQYLENHTKIFSQQVLPKRVRLSEVQIKQTIANKKPTVEILPGDWQEARLQFAVIAPDLDHIDMPTWDLLSSILGESDSSRLVRTVRNELGLVTGIDASCYTPKYPYGLFSIGFFCSIKNVVETLKIIINELTALAEVKPSHSEILRVVNTLRASRIYDQESVDGLTRNASFQLMTSKKLEFENYYLDKISKLNGEDVQKIAKSILEQINRGSLALSCAIDKKQSHVFSEADLLNAIKVPSHIFKKSTDRSKHLSHSIQPSNIDKTVKQIKINLPHNKVLRINFREQTRLPITSGMIVFRGGLISESEEKNGVGALTATMITRGTKRQNYRSFVEELEDNAASISAFSGREMFGMRFEGLADSSLRTLQMLLDCLFKPEFSATEWKKVKKETLEIINLQKDSASSQLSRIIQPLLYPNHPYQNLGVGTEESVSSLVLKDVVKFWKNLFYADEYIVSLAGDFNLQTFVRLLETEFSLFFSQSKLQSESKEALTDSTRPTSNAIRNAFYELNREQCHLMLCFRGASLSDERRTALEMAANILAGQGGRLFLDLRDQKSLAYSLSASQSPHQYGGTFMTYIACATHKVKDAFLGLKAHLEKLAIESPSEEELSRARKSVLGARSIESQHVSYQASQLAMSDAYGLGFDYFLKFEERLNQITPARISEVLKEMLIENPPIFAAVGSKDVWCPDQQNLKWNI